MKLFFSGHSVTGDLQWQPQNLLCALAFQFGKPPSVPEKNTINMNEDFCIGNYFHFIFTVSTVGRSRCARQR